MEQQTQTPGVETPDFTMIITDEPIAVLKSVGQKIDGLEVADEIPVVRGVGSSDLQDTDGDVFHRSALEKLVERSKDLNTLLNHDPNLPGSLFGSVFEVPELGFAVHQGKDRAVVKLMSDVEMSNPKAVQTYDYITGKRGRPRKLGFSVGCLYADCKRRGAKGLDIFDVEPVEWSVVTMPANRLAWIETVTKDLKRKGILPQVPNTWQHRDVRYVFEWKEAFEPHVAARLVRLQGALYENYGIRLAKEQ